MIGRCLVVVVVVVVLVERRVILVLLQVVVVGKEGGQYMVDVAILVYDGVGGSKGGGFGW